MASAKVQNLKAQFALFDKDGSGKLSKEEIRKAFLMWNMEIDDARLDDLMRRCATQLTL